MKFKKSITATLLMAVVMLAFTTANAKGKPEIAKKKWVEGQIIVKPRAGVSQEQLDRILKKNGGRSKARFKQINVHVVSVPQQAEEAMLKALSHNPHIEYCEKDMLVELSTVTPNDPKYGSQWHLPKIQAPEAWNTSAGEGITVAILDTGVEANHPDLVNNLVPGWNVVSNNSDTSPIMWHGTGVAGVVAATSNNSTGIASIAWNAKIMPIRVSNETDGVARFSSLASGVLWAADHGADVVNISYDMASANFMNDAAQYFRSKGGVTVVAAGNSNNNGGYSDNPYLITVAATDSNDNKASFSNYGDYIDVAAPGRTIYTTYVNGGYKTTSGTSFSSPATAGVVALIMAANPALTPEEVEIVLEQSADDPIAGTDWHQYFGHGRINAAAAVRLAQGATDVDTQAPNTTIFSPQNNAAVNGNVLVEVNATDNTGVTGVDLYADGQFVGRDLTAPYQFSWDSTQVADGNVTFTAYAQDSAGNEGVSNSLSVEVTNLAGGEDNTPPTVSIFDPADGSTVSDKVTIQVSSNDNVAVENLVVYIDGSRYRSTSYSAMKVSWWVNDISSGSHIITAIAKDAAGNSTETSVTVWKAQDSTDLDTEAPNATILSPQNNAVVSGNVLIEVNATDNTGVTGVDLYADEQFVGRDTAAPYQFSWDSTQIADGNVTLTAYAQDSVENEGVSNSLSVEVTNLPDGQDNTPPTISIFDPVDGSIVSGSVWVEVDATDDTDVTGVDLYADGQFVGRDSAEPYQFNWDSTQVADGNVTLTAYAQDSAGNEASSNSLSVDVDNLLDGQDNTSPTVNIINPADGSSVSGKVSISVTGSDNVAIKKLYVFIDGIRYRSTNYPGLRVNWYVQDISSGSHIISAIAIDTAGNMSESSVTVWK